MRTQTTKLYEVDGDRGNEKPSGPILGFVTWYPNETVHGQTERILRDINMALRTEPGSNVLKPKPALDYTHIKLIRYTSDHLVYELSYTHYPEGIRQREKDALTVTNRYILVKS